MIKARHGQERSSWDADRVDGLRELAARLFVARVVGQGDGDLAHPSAIVMATLRG